VARRNGALVYFIVVGLLDSGPGGWVFSRLFGSSFVVLAPCWVKCPCKASAGLMRLSLGSDALWRVLPAPIAS